MIRTVIIDDDYHRKRITSMVSDHIPMVDIVADADSVSTGSETILQHMPDLVLLDIVLKDGNGFDILSQIEHVQFKVIFISGYEEYALQAIRYSALDFLLKPVSLSLLRDAIEKVRSQMALELNMQLSELQSKTSAQDTKRIILRASDRMHLVPVQDIIRGEASRNYSRFWLVDGTSIVVCMPLKYFEELLLKQGFFRLHKSHIVNMSFVKTYFKADGGYVMLTDGMKIPVSDRKKSELIEKFIQY